MAKAETKAALYTRLVAARLWPEARLWKDARIEDLVAEGVTQPEAKEEAWRLLAAKYPPGAEADEAPAPESWGALPESAPFDAEVEWVHQNMVLVIEDRGTKPPRFHWDRARTSPPSYGAQNLMQFAATNRAGFMSMLQRVKPGMGGDGELVRREKVRIEEIRRILEQFRDIEIEAKVSRLISETELQPPLQKRPEDDGLRSQNPPER